MLVVGGRQAAGPAIEDLHGLGAGGDLAIQIFADEFRQPFHQSLPRFRRAIKKFLGVHIVARAAAFDQVGRQGERRAGKADERHFVFQFFADFFDRLVDEAKVRCRRRNLIQAVDIFAAAHRPMDHRAIAFGVFQADAHRFEDQQDIGEQYRRIDAQLLHRRDGDLRGEIGLLAQFEKAILGAQLAVFFHVAAGLAHEPDRRE